MDGGWRFARTSITILSLPHSLCMSGNGVNARPRAKQARIERGAFPMKTKKTQRKSVRADSTVECLETRLLLSGGRDRAALQPAEQVDHFTYETLADPNTHAFETGDGTTATGIS